MDGGEIAYVGYWISESRPLRRPPRGLPAHCGLLLGGQPWTIRTRIGDQWIIDSGDDDDAATPIEATLGSPGGMLDAHCDLLASDDAWPTTKPRKGHKFPCACTSPRPGDESHLGDKSYDENLIWRIFRGLARQFDHAVDRLRATQQATAGIMFGVAIAVWIVLSIILGATDPNVRRALRQVCGGGKKAPADTTTEAGGQSMSQEEIEAILAASLDAAAFVRVRVGFALRAVGLLLLTIGFAPLLTHVATSGFLTAVVGPYGFWGMFRLIGLTLFCMSVVPSDACGVRALQIFALIGFIVTTLVWVILIAEELAPRHLMAGNLGVRHRRGRLLRLCRPPGAHATVQAAAGRGRDPVLHDRQGAARPDGRRQPPTESPTAHGSGRLQAGAAAAPGAARDVAGGSHLLHDYRRRDAPSLISELIYDYNCEVCITDDPKFAYFGQYAAPAALILCIAFTTPANRRRVVRCLGSGRVTSNGQQRKHEQLRAAAVAALSGVGATSVSTLLTFLQTGDCHQIPVAARTSSTRRTASASSLSSSRRTATCHTSTRSPDASTNVARRRASLVEHQEDVVSRRGRRRHDR